MRAGVGVGVAVCGQMILAQSLVKLELGEKWLLPCSSAADAGDSKYRELLRLFGDEKALACRYSLHYMASRVAASMT
jgi:hypothetical protein